MGKRGMDELVGEHFGRVPFYTIFDSETKTVNVEPNTSAHAGGLGYPAEILGTMGIDVMLCGGLGGRAIQMFEEKGIMVYVGAQGRVRDAIDAYENEGLEAATDKNACNQHAFRGEGTGEGQGQRQNSHGDHDHECDHGNRHNHGEGHHNTH